MSDHEADAINVGVLTVDDQAAFRDVARAVIDATAGFVLLGEAGCGEDALALADELHPDLVLLDVRMPGIGGLETARRLSALHPDSRVVLISSDGPNPEGTPAVESCGAVAFLRKQDLGPSTLRRVWSEHGGPRPVDQSEGR